MCTGAKDIYSCGCRRITFDEPCDYFRCTGWKSFKPRNLKRGCYACNSRRNPIESAKPAAPEIITSKPDTDADTSTQLHKSLSTERIVLKVSKVVANGIEVGKEEVMKAIGRHIEEGFAKIQENLVIDRAVERGITQMCLQDISNLLTTLARAEEWLGEKYKGGDEAFAVELQEMKNEMTEGCLTALAKL